MRGQWATARKVGSRSIERHEPEPSGVITTAAVLFHSHELPPYKKAAAIISGGNVDLRLLAEVLAEEKAASV